VRGLTPAPRLFPSSCLYTSLRSHARILLLSLGGIENSISEIRSIVIAPVRTPQFNSQFCSMPLACLHCEKKYRIWIRRYSSLFFYQNRLAVFKSGCPNVDSFQSTKAHSKQEGNEKRKIEERSTCRNAKTSTALFLSALNDSSTLSSSSFWRTPPCQIIDCCITQRPFRLQTALSHSLNFVLNFRVVVFHELLREYVPSGLE
jgi:hypothetical protein